MRYKKTIITAATALSIGAVSLGVAVPAANAASTPTKPAVTVKIDRVHHDATVTTKRGTFDVRWEALAKGKRDLVMVRSSDHKLVAACEMGAKRLDAVLDKAAKKPGAIRQLLRNERAHFAKHHHGKKTGKVPAAAK